MMRAEQHNHDFHDREDGLAHCKVCNGAEGTLPTVCPGVRMTPLRENAVYAGEIDFMMGNLAQGATRGVAAWWAPVREWDEPRERQVFEDAIFAHYMRKSAERMAKGQGIANDSGPSHAEMFAREPGGDYVAIVYQSAWGGWKLARGGV